MVGPGDTEPVTINEGLAAALFDFLNYLKYERKLTRHTVGAFTQRQLQ